MPIRHDRTNARLRDVGYALALSALGYYLLAYWAAPALWRLVERHHPALESLAMRTLTVEGIPGDPVNVVFVGSEAQLRGRMLAAGWVDADPVSLGSATRIAADTLAHRAYARAPVSSLYFWGRHQDLAFEQAIGGDPRRRHHVRFWESVERDAAERPLWVGAATLDTRAGISHRTGQLTHHIDPAIDRERDKLLSDLSQSGGVLIEWIEQFQRPPSGRNGGGDPYETDARLPVISDTTIAPAP